MTTTTASLERTRTSRTQWLITLYAGGGEFCDGYILSIIGVALPLLTAAFSLTAVEAGLLGAAARQLTMQASSTRATSCSRAPSTGTQRATARDFGR
jgi:hypothetical protein